MDYTALAQLLFPNIDINNFDTFEKKYPIRDLPQNAIVTRMAPSPTGFIHLGNLLQGFTAERLAHQSGGVLFLRVEDTDMKREVKGAVKVLISSLNYYGIVFDEGAAEVGDDGFYGPYRQRSREDIYAVYAKKMVLEGKAYPCFCTADELKAIREKQTAKKENPGYYGDWAIWRDRSIEEITEMLTKNIPWVLRLRSDGNPAKRTKISDLIKGDLELPENDQDIVLLKSDKIPTYHFAHAVDDHLMRTTHVVRSDEWLSSLPIHIQLFNYLGFKMPKYLHIGPLMKMDGNSKRKLSKRKDPELALTFYEKEGYPPLAVKEYFLTILNSNYEDWRRANPDADYGEFNFSAKKMNPAGSLFDVMKLRDISKTVISKMTADEAASNVLAWSESFDKEFNEIIKKDAPYFISILNIGRGGKKPRKDIAVWSEVKDFVSFFYDGYFNIQDEIPSGHKSQDIKTALNLFAETYEPSDDSEAWFIKIKDICGKIGYCPSTKDYKNDPAGYKGHVGDVSMFIRIAVTGRLNSPDLYEVIKILGREAVLKRIDDYIKSL